MRGCPSYGCPIYPPELTDPKLKKNIRGTLESSGFSFGESAPQPVSTGSKPSTNDGKSSFEFAGGSFATLSQLGKSHVYNQDRAVLVPDYLADLLASTTSSSHQSFLACIFDGHGKLGHDVAQEIVEKFPLLLAEKLTRELGADANGDAILVKAPNYDRTDFIIQKALNETFLEVNEKGTESTFLLGGCTASVTLRWGSKLYVANAGDSQTILVSAAENEAQKQTNHPIVAKVEYHTRRDKANQPGERARIEHLGGTIHVNAEGFDPRVFVYSKAAGETIGLAMSRSLGDWEWKRSGVIAEPTIDVIDLTKLRSVPVIYLLVASDGFWDMRQQQFLATLAAPSFFVPSDDESKTDTKPQRLRPLFHLYDIIQRITPKIQRGYRDDITATIVNIMQ
eukprot:jgi/Psemu1/186730/e_gw1.61.61.1